MPPLGRQRYARSPGFSRQGPAVRCACEVRGSSKSCGSTDIPVRRASTVVKTCGQECPRSRLFGFRFMENLDLQLWKHLGTLTLHLRGSVLECASPLALWPPPSLTSGARVRPSLCSRPWSKRQRIAAPQDAIARTEGQGFNARTFGRESSPNGNWASTPRSQRRLLFTSR